MKSLAEAAVDAALGAGASYADARAVTIRRQFVITKNGQLDDVSDGESEGIGVRVLVNGAWGFAGIGRLDDDAARDTALRATEFARAAPGSHETSLAPVEAHTGDYRTPLEKDPFSVPLSEKIDLCLRAEEGMKHADVKVTLAMVRAQREHKVLVSSEGTNVEQDIYESGGGIDAYASADDISQIRSYPSQHSGVSGQGGWEFVEALGLDDAAPRIGEEAAALLRAPECPAGRTTVVLSPEQAIMQVHESVGHPTELDRVYGTEAAYAGTSFLSPADLGNLRYGSEQMNITADATTPNGLGTFAFDDEGVPARREAIVEAGVLRGFLSSRETAAQLGAGAGGSMRADGWSRMPLVRMTNLHLEPGEGSFEELLADVDDGLYLETNKSWSIDDKRLNFQFGTQIAWEIKNGRLGRMLRDATYTGVTPRFWAKLDKVAGPEEWKLFGLTNCGKGQPGQSAHVSHGASPARFRDVEVGVAT
ncbi:MAG TPA: TldD/PmbA family protein [Gaiellaceae bacterium]